MEARPVQRSAVEEPNQPRRDNGIAVPAVRTNEKVSYRMSAEVRAMFNSQGNTNNPPSPGAIHDDIEAGPLLSSADGENVLLGA